VRLYRLRLLVDEQGKPLIDQPLRERRRHLESFARNISKKDRLIRLSPMTCDILSRAVVHMGVGLDGIVAKREDLPYQSR